MKNFCYWRFIVIVILVFTRLPHNLLYAESAPQEPVLIKPGNEETGINLPPVLKVATSDADVDDELSVSFYGREPGATSAEDFMLVVIPDPQNESEYASDMFTSQTAWIVNCLADSNIIFTTCVGDLVNTASSEDQYEAADAAMDNLDDGGAFYSVSPGNHDEGSNSLWSDYFGISRFSSKSWYGGAYDDYNTYSFFNDGSGNNFIIINIEYQVPSDVLDWADEVLSDYSDYRAIVVQHDLLEADNSWDNKDAYTALKGHSNLFMMLCGHNHSTNDGAAYLEGTGDDGHSIHIIMANYQDMNYGNGYLRLLRFSPNDDMIYMTTYSPYSGEYITTSPDKMELSYDLEGGTDESDFEIIGSVSNIENGDSVALIWEDLSDETDYEWYAVVSDGSDSTTGETWSFTTGSTSVDPYPTAAISASPTSGEVELTVSFDAGLSSDEDGTIKEYSWDFADGDVGNGDIVSHEFVSSGIYEVSLNVKDDDGFSDEEIVTITVTEGGVSSYSMEAIQDSWIRSSQSGYNYGGSSTLQVSPYSSHPQGSLYQWDLSSVSSTAIVTAASITFYVTDESEYAFSLYNLIQEWEEGSGDGSETEDGATWDTYDGTNEWSEEGASSTTSDRDDVNLWDAENSDFASTGSITIDLNADGLEVVQGWIDGSLDNNGLTLQNYTEADENDYWIVASREHESYEGPTLNITCSTIDEPVITVTADMSEFITTEGTVSNEQTYTVSGTNLVNDIFIEAPDGFELSTDDSIYVSADTLTQTEGTVLITTIYVRLTGDSTGYYSDSIIHTSDSAASVELAVSGTVTSGDTLTYSEEVSQDAWIRSSRSDYNYGNASTLQASPYSSHPQGSLYQWDLSSISSTAVVSAANITFYVTNGSEYAFNLYNLIQEWEEGSGDGSETEDGATWDTYDGSNEWGEEGASSTTNDRDDVNLWDSESSDFETTGSVTIDLNADGLAVVQGWIDGSLDNNGLTLQNYTGANENDYWIVASKEHESYDGPTINITYSISSSSDESIAYISSGDETITTSSNSVKAASALEETDNKLDSKFSIYPNPAKDHIYIDPQNMEPKKVEIDIVDANGRKIFYSNRLDNGDSSNNYILNIEFLKPGIYIIRIIADGEQSYYRIIKQ